ncbi:hypothetical protein GCM10007424_26590 [Flavobacterium suaedae]|uniref:RDD domain-containing protein n=1 Tax=Flavobacterium suaedae TaxID=1767027 RepID=A0ABQ1K1T6_9FLAO|nr:RDD family protein [Flavobacterium suaedae]GGB85217.1 hypothetical protein GCM10007424_26590 [Flavobacterium suaedae]
MENQITAVYVDETMYASGGKRFANLLLDFVVQLVLGFLLGLFASLLYLAFGIDGPAIWIAEMGTLEERFLGVVILIVYYGLIESLTSRSIGKYITGTKVVMYDGSKPDAGTILLRTICRIIPFEAFSFLGSKARGWHDSLSKTYVIDVKKYEHAVMMKQSFEQIGQEETTELNNY